MNAAHASVKGAEAHLELAHAQYRSTLISFTRDLDAAGEYHGRAGPFWVDSGLCTTQEDADTLFATVDSVLDNIKSAGPEESARTIYGAHGRFLNMLSCLHDEPTYSFPEVPEPPTFSSKHASYAVNPVVETPGETSSFKNEGKGKQKETSPVDESVSGEHPPGVSNPLAASLLLAAAIVRRQENSPMDVD